MELTWKDQTKELIRDTAGIQDYLGLSPEEAGRMTEIIDRYPLCVHPYYLSLIDRDDPDDPIRRMCIPDLREFSPGGEKDTSGEADNTVFQGLQHKYDQTAMILSTNQCAMYCRHCFRKRMVGSLSDEIARQLPAMAQYVREHTEINNVLISGGDAFMNSTETIESYLRTFCAIPTLDFIRFGTRIPVVLPQRITGDSALLSLLARYGEQKQIIIVTQYNHPRELTPESIQAIKCLREAGCIIRNQTVLLKGVNDHPKTLADLMNGLVSHGAIPYYIFQCRPVEGVQNQFQLPLLRGMDLVDQARQSMNGQAKSVRFVLSHPTGKLAIVGKVREDLMVFKYHQAKEKKDQGRVFALPMGKDQCWLEKIPNYPPFKV